MILNEPIPPWIRMPDGQVLSLAQCALPQVLDAAAAAEGLTDWWAGEDLLVGVRTYLTRHHSGETLEAAQLELSLITALVAIGRPEVAVQLRRAAALAGSTAVSETRVCLEALAQAADGHEMVFRVLLAQELERVVNSPAPGAHFAKLRSAVRHLAGGRKWNEYCADLESVIIELIHAKIGESGRVMRLALTLG